MKNLKEHIQDIQKRLKNKEYPNEQAISQGIVLRLLNALQWDIHDTQAVFPEYPIEGTRVDYALLIPRKRVPVIFIEVKQPGKALGADKQLFQYAYHQGIPLVILTDGKEWHFYLPSGMGYYDERKFCKLDLVEQDKQESLYRLERYLTYDQVKNGKALKHATKDYENVSKERETKNNIPVAWGKLLEEKDESLINVISEKVESICDFKPAQDDVLEYLYKLKKPVNASSSPPPREKRGSDTSRKLSEKTKPRAKLKVTFPDRTKIHHPKVSDTMVGVIRKIGCKKVRQLKIRVSGKNLIMSTRPSEERNWAAAGSGYYICTHSSTEEKFKLLNKINERLALGLKIEKV